MKESEIILRCNQLLEEASPSFAELGRDLAKVGVGPAWFHNFPDLTEELLNYGTLSSQEKSQLLYHTCENNGHIRVAKLLVDAGARLLDCMPSDYGPEDIYAAAGVSYKLRAYIHFIYLYEAVALPHEFANKAFNDPLIFSMVISPATDSHELTTAVSAVGKQPYPL